MKHIFFILSWWMLALPSWATEISFEVKKTFDQGWVYFKQGEQVKYSKAIESFPALQQALPADIKGVVVYMHGCDGINWISRQTAGFLATQGYLVLMPDSFVRSNKPTSCDPITHKGGLHREVLAWRQAEADYAIKQAKSLPGITTNKVVLMGLSEGAITTATYQGEPVAARVIEGWTCHRTDWPEYHGLFSPESEPVLALSSEGDPWFQHELSRGDCGAFIKKPTDLRRSIVYRAPHAAAKRHELMWSPEIRQLLINYLTLVFKSQ